MIYNDIILCHIIQWDDIIVGYYVIQYIFQKSFHSKWPLPHSSTHMTWYDAVNVLYYVIRYIYVKSLYSKWPSPYSKYPSYQCVLQQLCYRNTKFIFWDGLADSPALNSCHALASRLVKPYLKMSGKLKPTPKFTQCLLK